MINRRILLSAGLALTLMTATVWPGSAGAASAEEGAKAFLNNMADQAIRSLTKSGVSRPERIEHFRKLFKNNFAARTIGKWILGRYWRKATPEQQKEYFNLFEDLIVVSYVDRFAQYTGEGLKIIKTLAHNDRVTTVFSEIQQQGSTTPVRVDWRISKTSTSFKVVDVVVEGTSMSITMKSDFGSIIRQKGGKIAGLLEVLRDKTASLKKEAAAK